MNIKKLSELIDERAETARKEGHWSEDRIDSAIHHAISNMLENLAEDIRDADNAE